MIRRGSRTKAAIEKSMWFRLILSLSIFVAGCASPKTVDNGAIGYTASTPVVMLESAVETADSPGSGYPLALMMPIYPFAMQRAGITGWVVVRVKVSAEGRVEEASVVESSQKEFERTTLYAAERWTFLEIPDFITRERRGLILDCKIKFAFEEE